jgi:hypothetical protein
MVAAFKTIELLAGRRLPGTGIGWWPWRAAGIRRDRPIVAVAALQYKCRRAAAGIFRGRSHGNCV